MSRARRRKPKRPAESDRPVPRKPSEEAGSDAPGSRLLATAARALLIALLALAPVSLGRFLSAEPVALLLVLAVAGLLWIISGRPILPRRLSASDWLLLAALGGSVIVTAWSVCRYDSWLAMPLLICGPAALFLFRACFADDSWRLRAWWALAFGGAVAGLWGLREYVLNAVIIGDPTWRVFGPFYNPNCLAGYLALALAIPVALALGAGTRSRAQPNSRNPAGEPAPRYSEIIGTISAIVIGLALLCTGSKGGIIAALVAGLVVAILGADRRARAGKALRWIALGVVALGMVGVVSLPPIRGRIIGAFSSQQHSGSFRVHTWRGTLDMIAARPLTGFGPGSFAHAYPRFARAGFTRQAHQTPLQLAAENGVLVAGLWLVGLAAVLWRIGRAGLIGGGRKRLLAAACVGGHLGLWAHNLVDYTWYVAAINVTSWAILGLASAPEATGDEVRSARPARALAAALTAALILASSVALYSESQLAAGRRLARIGALGLAETRLCKVLPIDARGWVELSRTAEHRGALQEAVAARERAVALQPTEPTHYVSLGRIHSLLGEHQSAEAALEKGVDVYPTSTEALAALGRVRENLGRNKEALEVYRRLVALYDTPVRTSQAVQYFVDENYAFGWMALARDAASRNQTARAAEFAAKALRVATEFIEAQRTYREMLQVAGQYDPAEIRELEELADEAMALLRETDEPVGALWIGLALRRLDRTDEAIDALDGVIGELDGAEGFAERLVLAYARLIAAECLAELDQPRASAHARSEGLRLAEEVLPRLPSNQHALPFGWDDEDTGGLRKAVAAAGE